MPLEISELTEETVADFGRIHALGWQYAYKGIVSAEILAHFTPEKRAAVFKRAMKNPDELFYIAKSGQDPAGILILAPRVKADQENRQKTGEVKAIYLEPELIGKGFGRELMTFAVTELRKHGDTRIVLWVLKDNARARTFYEEFGFRSDGVTQDIELGKPVCEMRYSLGIE